jgi:hypothetical protein
MAKLYAELTSDKGGRVASKGGEAYVEVNITHQNRQLWNIKAGAHGLLIIERNGKIKKHNSLNF